MVYFEICSNCIVIVLPLSASLPAGILWVLTRPLPRRFTFRPRFCSSNTASLAPIPMTLGTLFSGMESFLASSCARMPNSSITRLDFFSCPRTEVGTYTELESLTSLASWLLPFDMIYCDISLNTGPHWPPPDAGKPVFTIQTIQQIKKVIIQ